MKEPDKIFLNRRHPEPYWFKDKQLDSDVEYIRKDALLGWAKEWQKELPEGLGASMVHHVLNEVIDKIESL